MNKPQKAQPAKPAKPPVKAGIVKTDRHFVTALARGLVPHVPAPPDGRPCARRRDAREGDPLFP